MRHLPSLCSTLTKLEQPLSLTDFFVSLHLPKRDLQRLNHCRVFLQVIFIADITDADGTSITPCYKSGYRCPYRSSWLDWPYQPSPPAPDWLLWKKTLRQLESNSVLRAPLGEWIMNPHQCWHLFLNPVTQILYHHKSNSSWLGCNPILPSSPKFTRSTQRAWYNLPATKPILSPPLIPVRPLLERTFHDSLCRVSISSAFPPEAPLPAPASLHILSHGSPHSYYKYIMQ